MKRAPPGGRTEPLNCKGAEPDRQARAGRPVKVFGIADSFSSLWSACRTLEWGEFPRAHHRFSFYAQKLLSLRVQCARTTWDRVYFDLFSGKRGKKARKGAETVHLCSGRFSRKGGDSRAKTQVDAGKRSCRMFQFGVLSALATALTSVLSALLLLALTRQLWSLRWSLTRDKESSLPLPRGSMGWPLVGETFHWLFQVSSAGSSSGLDPPGLHFIGRRFLELCFLVQKQKCVCAACADLDFHINRERGKGTHRITLFLPLKHINFPLEMNHLLPECISIF